MVNVSYNHTFLCTFTTAILYFLQVAYVSAAGNLCDPEAPFYECGDGKRHIIKNKTYHLKNSWRVRSDSAPIAAIYVERKNTVVEAFQITVLGDNPDTISAYGGYVRYGGKLILTDSNFKDAPGIRAHNAVISMTRGSIKGTSHAVYASGKEADIGLVNVNIDIQPDNLKTKGIAIVSGFGATVRMSDSAVTFNEIGSFSTRFGGRYFLDSVVIKGEGKKQDSIVGNKNAAMLPQAFEVFQASDVYLRGNSIQLTDMRGFLIKNFSGYADDNGKLIQNYDSPYSFKNTNIKIERSDISVQEEGARGLYFHVAGPDESAKMLNLHYSKTSEAKKVIAGVAFVSLSQTTFVVPDGIAIYATGDKSYRAEGILELSNETKISGDLLLKAENNSSLLVKASASSLTGGMHVEDTSTARLELTHGSTWYLTKSKYNGLQESVSSLSSLSLSDSTLIFDDEDISNGYQTLRIGKRTDINEGDKVVLSAYKKAYSAEGNAQVKLSAFLDDEGLFDPQKTDRILIYGDVSGTTLVHMQNFLTTSGKEIRDGKDQSLSLIQVSGMAQEDSFKLANSYTTVNGFPYQYRLRGYGPGSSFGEADATQRLVEGDGKFWDFRLEGIYVNPESDSSEIMPVISSPSVLPDPSEPAPTDPAPTPFTSASSSSVPPDPSESVPPDPAPTPFTSVSSSSVLPDPSEPAPTDPPPTPPSPFVSPTPSASDPSDPIPTDLSPSPTPPVPIKPDIQPELGIRAVVPQLPTYLLLPNALFHAGLLDLSTQNKKLEAIRSVSQNSLKSDENPAFFIRGYGGSHHYASNLSIFEYGYGAELDYTALEAGVLLKEIENLYNHTFFGVTGTYGNLSLYPLNVEQSKKSTFDKWSVSAYGSLQHDTGFYMDGLLSYGLFRGDVFTLARGKAATLKGKQLSTSLTSGKTFIIGHNGVVFDPQVQLVYQHLQFNRVRDVDDLDVDMGKFDQWTARFGGRLTKMFAGSEEGHVISFYSKLYLLHSFGDKQLVSFKKDFQLGAFGSSLEAGIGFNTRLSAKFVLHGDINYQHRLTKAGFSGISFSGNLHYHF
ncbi:autotransporter outer membrane beta-barrel domain-containing protein [Bartonella taylorii]|uniref:autotransporter outer membrane beta-barrel domain-containing protein n=1 Tax=Bartonella taylorii TaxID=33046 RepID=UPI00208E06A3|nr:autotransporter outer membrane beta-barrel domain-containing protein [Bartonella taylorii]USP02027.1 autotransporter outer membrane beta-barrel domain-containing protein [Bartonella taylorii]